MFPHIDLSLPTIFFRGPAYVIHVTIVVDKLWMSLCVVNSIMKSIPYGVLGLRTSLCPPCCSQLSLPVIYAEARQIFVPEPETAAL